MLKRLSVIFYLLIALIVASVVSAYLLRNVLLEALVRAQLSKQGFPVQSIALLDVSSDEFLLQGLIAGKNKEFRIHEAHVIWQLRDLFSAKPISVEINRLTMDMAIGAEKTSFARLSSEKSSFDVRDFSLPWMPLIMLRNATINVHSAVGVGSVTLSGEINATESDGRSLHLDVILSGTLAQGSIALNATSDALGNMQGRIAVVDGGLQMPKMRIAHFQGDTTFKFTAMQLQNIQTEFVFSDVFLNPEISAASEAEVKIEQLLISGDVVGLPEFLTGDWVVRVKNGQWSFESVKLQQLDATMPLQIDMGRGNYRIGLRESSTVTIGEVKPIHPAARHKKMEFSITQVDVEWTENDGDWSLQHKVVVVSSNLALIMARDDATKLNMDIHPGVLTWAGKIDGKMGYQGKFAIGDTAILLPQMQLKTSGIAVDINWNDATLGNGIDFSVEQLQFLLPQSLLVPVSFTGSVRSVTVASSEYVLSLSGGIPGLNFMHIKGNHAINNGSGKLSIELGPLVFSPDGLQPGALLPWLSQWKNVSGQINANAQLDWSASRISNSSGALDIHDFSFEHDSIVTHDLNMSLYLENLFVPNSPPHQVITIHRVDLGAVIENFLFYYQLKQVNPLHLIIEKAQFSFMEGKILISPASIFPENGADLMVNISDFNLGTLFDLIQIDGLSGNGRLDGQIPLTLTGDQIVIKDGLLAAQAPGVLHFKSEKAARYLVSGGEEMNLLLHTLRDFHYTELALHLDKSADHNLSIKLSLLGNNPQVRDGQEFRLNFKLETELDKLLHAIKKGYGLSQEILGGSFRLH